MIKINELAASVSSGIEVLSAQTFDIREGGALGIYGPNGSGKSTLLRAIGGVSQDRSLTGEVMINSVLINENLNPAERIRQVLYLGSDFNTPFELTVKELLELGAEVMGRSQGNLIEVVNLLHIENFLERNFRSLSDGEKQLMMFARVLIQKPKVLIFDESFSKLDLDKLILVAKVLRKFCSQGLTIIIASHDLNFLTECSDELIFLKAGEKIAAGVTSEVLTRATLESIYPNLALHVVVSPETGRLKILY